MRFAVTVGHDDCERCNLCVIRARNDLHDQHRKGLRVGTAIRTDDGDIEPHVGVLTRIDRELEIEL